MVTTVLWITTLWVTTERADQYKYSARDEGSTSTGDG